MPNSVSDSAPKPLNMDNSEEESSSEEQPIMNRAPVDEQSDSDGDTDSWSMETSSLIDSVYHTDSQSEGELGDYEEPVAANGVGTPPIMESPSTSPPTRPTYGMREMYPGESPPGPIRNVARRGRINRHMIRRGDGRRYMTPFERGETFNGFERNMELDEITGFGFEHNNTNLLYNVRWRGNGDSHQIESTLLRTYTPDALINYYEDLIRRMYFDITIHPRTIINQFSKQNTKSE